MTPLLNSAAVVFFLFSGRAADLAIVRASEGGGKTQCLPDSDLLELIIRFKDPNLHSVKSVVIPVYSYVSLHS